MRLLDRIRIHEILRLVNRPASSGEARRRQPPLDRGSHLRADGVAQQGQLDPPVGRRDLQIGHVTGLEPELAARELPRPIGEELVLHQAVGQVEAGQGR